MTIDEFRRNEEQFLFFIRPRWNVKKRFHWAGRIYRIDGIFFAARIPSAEGRSILTILSNYFSKIRIHSSNPSILHYWL